MLTDMHAHLSCMSEEYSRNRTPEERLSTGIQELEWRRAQGTAAFFSFGTPGEWAFMQRLEQETGIRQKTESGHAAGSDIWLQALSGEKQDRLWDTQSRRTGLWKKSFGIHPWYSDRFDPEQYMEYYRQCDAVGEIGMDSVWCSVPLKRQRKILEQQLMIAEQLGKPVFLHTKGQEREIYDIVCDFPGKVCVHWYSGDIATFQKYLEKGCYFTLGPDLGQKCRPAGKYVKRNMEMGSTMYAEQQTEEQESSVEKASAGLYQYMLDQIPVNRLFLETDGLEAVAWAYGAERVPMQEITAVLWNNLNCLAEWKGFTKEQMEQQLQKNLEQYLCYSSHVI